jgi:outer membrane protein, multidrug efflux system
VSTRYAPIPRQTTLVAAAALSLLAACATPGSPAPAPATPTLLAADAWQAPLPALPHGGSTPELARWWQQFDDPLLPELVAAAQAASPSLAAARARIERARATAVAAGAQGLPRLDGVAAASQGRPQPGVPTVTSASLGLQASWEIDLFGGVAAGQQAARERLRGAQAGWHDARVSLAADVAAAYTNLRACEAQLAQSRLDAQSRTETARLTDLSAKSGFTAPADAALVRAGAAQARSQALAQQAQCDGLVKGLVELTDRPEPTLRQQLASAQARVPTAPAIAPAALPAALLSQRPDLAAAAAAVQAAAADISQSRADELPRVAIAGSLAQASVRSQGSTTNGSTWSLGPLQVSFPLFDAGSRRANTEAARAAYDEAVAAYQGAARRAWREVETALVDLDATAQRERDVRAAAGDFEASLRATEARARGGLASQLDLEAARRNAVQAQSTLIELQRERATAWIALYRGLGGGWTADMPVATTASRTPAR